METVEDQSKDVARWQLEFTKMQRRAKAAEDDNTRLKATHDEMHARFEREHHARTALELRLKDVFAAPVVKEALASHPAGTTRRDDPYGMGNVLRAGEDTDGSETAMLVFKALEDRITRDRDALEAANAREVRLATMLRHSASRLAGPRPSSFAGSRCGPLTQLTTTIQMVEQQSSGAHSSCLMHPHLLKRRAPIYIYSARTRSTACISCRLS